MVKSALPWVALAVFILVATVSPVAAQSLSDDVQIHGFGGWALVSTLGVMAAMAVPYLAFAHTSTIHPVSAWASVSTKAQISASWSR